MRDEKTKPAEMPAFPFGRDAAWGGLTLRDYFAGQALAGMMANPSESENEAAEDIAAWAYQLADGMLYARTREAKP